MNEINILGVKIMNISFDESIKFINNLILRKKPSQIATVNPEFIMLSQSDHEFKDVLNNTELNVPDGQGLILASKITGQKLNNRVTGIDLVWALAELAEKRNYSIFLLGGRNGVAEKTKNVLLEKYPRLKIAGTFEGNPIFKKLKTEHFKTLRITDLKKGVKDKNYEIIEKIRKTKPHILFVAYGAPKQDKFISRYKKLLNVPVMIGVGGSFDFISGNISRAPKWMRNVGLEWLYRLFKEPNRFNRILTATIRFPYAVLKNRIFKS